MNSSFKLKTDTLSLTFGFSAETQRSYVWEQLQGRNAQLSARGTAETPLVSAGPRAWGGREDPALTSVPSVLRRWSGKRGGSGPTGDPGEALLWRRQSPVAGSRRTSGSPWVALAGSCSLRGRDSVARLITRGDRHVRTGQHAAPSALPSKTDPSLERPPQAWACAPALPPRQTVVTLSVCLLASVRASLRCSVSVSGGPVWVWVPTPTSLWALRPLQ